VRFGRDADQDEQAMVGKTAKTIAVDSVTNQDENWF
jgi:hypothetical protein